MAKQLPPLKIAYYTINDPRDKRSWSGITYYLGKTLGDHLGEVHYLGPVEIPWLLDKSMRGLQKLNRFLFKTEWLPKYSLLKNAYAARALRRKMRGHDYDFLVAPAAASELALLRTSLPVVYFGDATFKQYCGMYQKEFGNVGAISRWEGEFLERRALKKSQLVLFSSHWALRSALEDYRVPGGKLGVIQMGPNIDSIPGPMAGHAREQETMLTLLFLGVDWERKGGPIAYDTLLALKARGIATRLIVCGCRPPAGFHDPAMEVIPFLDKNKPADLANFTAIISASHFLLLPTRADCTPMVNCEAAAYGVPVITTDVGGVSEAVRNGVNGYCLPPEAGADQYAEKISAVFADKKAYRRLVKGSRERFEKVLNWEQFTIQLRQELTSSGIIG